VVDQESFSEACQRYLAERWRQVLQWAADEVLHDVLSDDCRDLKAKIRRSLTGSTKSYHYVLPPQVLCKVVDATLDAHCLQKAWGVSGAFDARTIAHSVIVLLTKTIIGYLVVSPCRCQQSSEGQTAVIADNRTIRGTSLAGTI
jgi:hypothetical protein